MASDTSSEPRRRVFVGDLQGCREELERLLEKVRFDPAGDVLCPVGDLVNRGPDSLGTLRLCRDLGVRAVLGNHDLHLLRTARGGRALGPADTLDEVLAAPDREVLLDWLAALPFVVVEPDVIQVHAGLHPDWCDAEAVRRALDGKDPLQPDAAVEFATHVRLCDASGARPSADDATEDERFRPWFRHRPSDEERTLVFGHWAARGRVEEPGLRGLDTGCVWGGSLTAWVAEEDRLVSVPAARAYREPRAD